jgi:hypothetical protein
MVVLADVAGLGPGDLIGPILIAIMSSMLGGFLALWTAVIGFYGRQPVRIFKFYLGGVATASLGMNMWLFDFIQYHHVKRAYLLGPSLAIVVTLCGIVAFVRATEAA